LTGYRGHDILVVLHFWEFFEMANVTFVTGDGIGPEIAEATRRCIDATGAGIEWDIVEAGSDVMERLGTPLPEPTVESIKKNGIAIKAPSRIDKEERHRHQGADHHAGRDGVSEHQRSPSPVAGPLCVPAAVQEL